MTTTETPIWDARRTDESRYVEEVLRQAGFARAEAYRYNSASIRLRVIDPRFETLSIAERDALVERHLAQLPERTQADIMTLLTLAPSELLQSSRNARQSLLNLEFDDPSPSQL